MSAWIAPSRLRGNPLVAAMRTDQVRGTAHAWSIVVRIVHPTGDEYCSAIWFEGDDEWNNGHYHDSYAEALADAFERAKARVS